MARKKQPAQPKYTEANIFSAIDLIESDPGGHWPELRLLVRSMQRSYPNTWADSLKDALPRSYEEWQKIKDIEEENEFEES